MVEEGWNSDSDGWLGSWSVGKSRDQIVVTSEAVNAFNVLKFILGRRKMVIRFMEVVSVLESQE